jgi:hypothetical protein
MLGGKIGSRQEQNVAQQGGTAIGGAVAGLFGGMRIAAERAFLEQAKRIEADRAA